MSILTEQHGKSILSETKNSILFPLLISISCHPIFVSDHIHFSSQSIIYTGFTLE